MKSVKNLLFVTGRKRKKKQPASNTYFRKQIVKDSNATDWYNNNGSIEFVKKFITVEMANVKQWIERELWCAKCIVIRVE